eukprot:g25480.t1
MQMRTVPFFFAAEGGKGAAWQRNAYLLDEMTWKRQELNEVLYGVAMNAYAKSFHWKDASILLDELSDAQLK